MAGKGRSTPYGGNSGLPNEGRGIYIGGLSFSTEWQELKDHMRQAGAVEFVDILANPDGSSKGTAYLRYETPAEAENAIACLNGSTLGEKTLTVDLWTGYPPKRQGCKGGKGGKGGKPNMMAMMNMMKGGCGGCGKGGGGSGEGGERGEDSKESAPNQMMMNMMNMMNPMQLMMMNMMGMGGMGMGGMAMNGGPKKNEKEKKVKVMDVPMDKTWQDLKAHMQSVGTVEFCNVRNGIGEVRYSTEEEAQMAITMLNGSNFGGSTLGMCAFD